MQKLVNKLQNQNELSGNEREKLIKEFQKLRQ